MRSRSAFGSCGMSQPKRSLMRTTKPREGNWSLCLWDVIRWNTVRGSAEGRCRLRITFVREAVSRRTSPPRTKTSLLPTASVGTCTTAGSSGSWSCSGSCSPWSMSVLKSGSSRSESSVSRRCAETSLVTPRSASASTEKPWAFAHSGSCSASAAARTVASARKCSHSFMIVSQILGSSTFTQYWSAFEKTICFTMAPAMFIVQVRPLLLNQPFPGSFFPARCFFFTSTTTGSESLRCQSIRGSSSWREKSVTPRFVMSRCFAPRRISRSCSEYVPVFWAMAALRSPTNVSSSPSKYRMETSISTLPSASTNDPDTRSCSLKGWSVRPCSLAGEMSSTGLLLIVGRSAPRPFPTPFPRPFPDSLALFRASASRRAKAAAAEASSREAKRCLLAGCSSGCCGRRARSRSSSKHSAFGRPLASASSTSAQSRCRRVTALRQLSVSGCSFMGNSGTRRIAFTLWPFLLAHSRSSARSSSLGAAGISSAKTSFTDLHLQILVTSASTSLRRSAGSWPQRRSYMLQTSVKACLADAGPSCGLDTMEGNTRKKAITRPCSGSRVSKRSTSSCKESHSSGWNASDILAKARRTISGTKTCHMSDH
mmetsp:Transcript_12365/g.26753  ORF Transcript_12365/g.26753 Transcript_12365/m.26753 type:complete len:598 (+) Transcript_12365:158-1951(+)